MTRTATGTERQAAFAPLIRQGLDLVESKYGDVSGKGSASVMWLPYHGRTHSGQVAAAARWNARQLAKRGQLDPADVPLAELAGAWHDVEQMQGPVQNERASGLILVGAMDRGGLFVSQANGITPAKQDDATKVLAMIDGTAVDFVDGSLIARADASDVLQATLADADMSSLGASNGPFMSLMLFAEMQSKAGNLSVPDKYSELSSFVVDQEAFAGYLEGQARLFENHQYLTEPMRSKLSAGLEANVRWMSGAAQWAKDGDLTFGAALDSAAMRLDRSFAIRPEGREPSQPTLGM